MHCNEHKQSDTTSSQTEKAGSTHCILTYCSCTLSGVILTHLRLLILPPSESESCALIHTALLPHRHPPPLPRRQQQQRRQHQLRRQHLSQHNHERVSSDASYDYWRALGWCSTGRVAGGRSQRWTDRWEDRSTMQPLTSAVLEVLRVSRVVHWWVARRHSYPPLDQHDSSGQQY